jgi:hypothetical protein
MTFKSFLILFTFIFGSLPPAFAESEPPFEFTVSPEKDTVHYGEPIRVVVTVRNVSKENRCFVDSADRNDYGNYTIALRVDELAPGGNAFNQKEFIWKPAVVHGPTILNAPRTYFLKPGEAFTSVVPLSEGLLPYNFKELSVEVSYRHDRGNWDCRCSKADPEAPKDGLPAWKGELRSNRARIRMAYPETAPGT